MKGGVGASSIAHNLAWALSERVKVNATLIDLDLNFGTTGLDFNQDPQATIADALMSPDRFDDAVMGRLITKATDRLSLFTAPATLDRTYNLEPETYDPGARAGARLGPVRRARPAAHLDRLVQDDGHRRRRDRRRRRARTSPRCATART